jgi:hypothetical protein
MHWIFAEYSDKIQYSAERQIPPRASRCAFLGDIPCMRIYRQCTGIKACEFLDSRLQSSEHEEVDSGHWTLINQLRLSQHTGVDSIKVKAQHFAQAAKELWNQGVPCIAPHYDCELEPVECYQVREILIEYSFIIH